MAYLLYYKPMSTRNRKAQKRWFKAKEYGWGWYPASWQGWVITFLYASLYVISMLLFFAWAGAAAEARSGYREVAFGVLEFLAVIVLLTYSLIRICTRFGEPARWRWGKAGGP